MIIIKSIIIYFMQITHTDDFPSTGTWLPTYINSASITPKYAFSVGPYINVFILETCHHICMDSLIISLYVNVNNSKFH